MKIDSTCRRNRYYGKIEAHTEGGEGEIKYSLVVTETEIGISATPRLLLGWMKITIFTSAQVVW